MGKIVVVISSWLTAGWPVDGCAEGNLLTCFCYIIFYCIRWSWLNLRCTLFERMLMGERVFLGCWAGEAADEVEEAWFFRSIEGWGVSFLISEVAYSFLPLCCYCYSCYRLFSIIMSSRSLLLIFMTVLAMELLCAANVSPPSNFFGKFKVELTCNGFEWLFTLSFRAYVSGGFDVCAGNFPIKGLERSIEVVPPIE